MIRHAVAESGRPASARAAAAGWQCPAAFERERRTTSLHDRPLDVYRPGVAFGVRCTGVLVLSLGACGSPAQVPDAAHDVDARIVDALPMIDAEIPDADPCPPVAAPSGPAYRRALGVRERARLRIFADRGSGFELIDSFDGLGHFNRVAWGDLDGDGTDELATGWLGDPSHESQIYDLTPQGELVLLSSLLGAAQAMRWFDFDGDEFDDLYRGTANFDHVFCGGSSELDLCWSFATAMPTSDVIAIGDADADGDDDVAVGGAELRIYRNTGAQLALALQSSLGDRWVRDIDWVELDGCAGDELLVTAEPFGGPYQWVAFRREGSGYVELPFATPPAQSHVWAWADFDGDADADALGCDAGATTLFRRNGVLFEPGPSFTTEYCMAGAWGDFDGDGDPDLAYTDVPDIVIARNDDGTFVEVLRVASDAPDLEWGRCGPASTPCFPPEGT